MKGAIVFFIVLVLAVIAGTLAVNYISSWYEDQQQAAGG